MLNLLIQLLYGQVFFLLGMVMALQWRQRSRLELATGLPLLAAFGFFEAFHEWGDVFAPFIAGLNIPHAELVFLVFQRGLLVMSFAALGAYGTHLLKPEWNRSTVMLGSFLLALVAACLPWLIWGQDSEAMLRYTICMISAALVALGLRVRSRRLSGPQENAAVIRNLRVAGISFLAFGFFEGIFPPPAVFFPASVLNEQTFLSVTGAPISLFRALSGCVILFFFFRALEVFHLETQRIQRQLEHEQSLNQERQRISRDLHDGTLQTIYASGLVLEDARISIKTACEMAKPGEDANVLRQGQMSHANAQLESVSAMLGKIVEDIRKAVYDLRATPHDGDLSRGLIEIVSEFRMRSGIATEWRASGNPPRPLTADETRHAHQILREALSNVQRHAHATQALVEMRYASPPEKAFRLMIQDNGAGGVPQSGQVGRGLQNMRERAQLLNGQVSITQLQGGGVGVILEFD